MIDREGHVEYVDQRAGVKRWASVRYRNDRAWTSLTIRGDRRTDGWMDGRTEERKVKHRYKRVKLAAVFHVDTGKVATV